MKKKLLVLLIAASSMLMPNMASAIAIGLPDLEFGAGGCTNPEFCPGVSDTGDAGQSTVVVDCQSLPSTELWGCLQLCAAGSINC